MNAQNLLFAQMPYTNPRKQERLLYLCFLILFTIFQTVNVLTGAYRYTLYIVPAIAAPFYLFYVLHTHTLFSNPYLRNVTKLFAGLTVYAAASGIIQNGFYERLVDELGLMLLPLIFAQILTLFYHNSDKERTENILLGGYVITYFLQIFVFPKQTIEFSLEDILLSTTFAFESGLSFIFAMFYIYYLLQGNKKRAGLCLALTILSYKRIAIVGVLLVTGIYFILSWLHLWNRWIPRSLVATVAVAINLLVITVIYQFINGAFDHAISAYLHVSANQLTAGRQVIYRELTYYLDSSVFGVGLGKTTEIMRSLEFFKLENLHSDVLKLYTEIGIIGFLPFIWIFFYINSSSMATLILAVFMNILWLTDNVFLYFQVMTVFYLLQSFLVMQQQSADSAYQY